MTISKVSFTSRETAESQPGAPGIAVISITDPGSPPAALSPCFGPLLRLAFYDAVPADDYLPAPCPGLFDHRMAREVCAFIDRLQAARETYAVLVHCEYGISRSAAVALFVEAACEVPLQAREYACDANSWVMTCLERARPKISIDLPLPEQAHDRRQGARHAR